MSTATQPARPDVAVWREVDPESGERRIVDTGHEGTRAAYANQTGEARERLTRLFRELGLEVVEVGSEDDYVPVLAEFFRARERTPARRRGRAPLASGRGALR